MRLLMLTFPPNKRALEGTESDQIVKVFEEFQEFKDANLLWRTELDTLDHVLEEALDTMIALDNWLDKHPMEAVQAAIAKVLEKGEERGDWEVS